MTQNIIEQLHFAKSASGDLRVLEDDKCHQILHSIANKLRESCAIILRENAKDLVHLSKEHPMYDRLLLTNERIHALAKDIEAVIVLKIEQAPISAILFQE